LKPIALPDRRTDPRAGYALIEMLAALSIAVAILALLAQFTYQALRNWNRGESTIAAMEMLTSGLGRLRTDLALAVPMRPPGSDGDTVLFQGDVNRLLFVAATGFGPGDGGLELISITIGQDQEGTFVVRERGPVTSTAIPLRDPVLLLRGRMRVQFSYRGADGLPVNTWTERGELPKAVVVDIFGATGTTVFAAPVLLRLPINLSPVCLAGDPNENVPVVCPTRQRAAAPGRGRS
jgi:general secretion pathway protein J